MRHRGTASVGTSILLAVLVAPRAEGFFTYVVNGNGDAVDANPGDGVCQTATPGVCTLRAAVEEANATSGAVIGVPAITITLTLGHLQISRDTSIRGAGMTRTVVSGGGVSRVLVVEDGETNLSDMTIRDGIAPQGGGILVELGASLVVERCLLVNNQANLGGAIRSAGSLTLVDSLVTDNHVFVGNGFSALGGGIMAGSTATLLDSTISENTSTVHGGGVYFSGPQMDVLSCTVSGNSADDSGGGLYVAFGKLSLLNSTIASNTAFDGTGGGVGSASSLPVSLVATILSYNLRAEGQLLVFDDCAGAMTSGYGKNIILDRDPTHCSVNGAYSAADPLLGLLRDNGGHGPTHALLAGSPAIDAGVSEVCEASLTTDQRGAKRSIGPCDMGAYERAPCGDVNGDGSIDVIDIFFLVSHLFAAGPIPPGLSDVNGDGERNVTDVFRLVGFLFAGGPSPICPGT
jgi:CSLREA domain-containing protein